jgi:hypothetical protein
MVGPECPNPDKLKLGDNNIYRAAILEAGKRLGLIPQAICGLLSCEAATENITLTMKNANGQAIVATKGKNKGKPIQKIIGKRWKANSYNASSHAAWPYPISARHLAGALPATRDVATYPSISKRLGATYNR